MKKVTIDMNKVFVTGIIHILIQMLFLCLCASMDYNIKLFIVELLVAINLTREIFALGDGISRGLFDDAKHKIVITFDRENKCTTMSGYK